MNEQFREQINTARRAGYSDADIVNFLGKQDPRFGEALSAGYKPNEILSFMAPPPTTGENIVRQAGVAGRATAPYATVATAAAPFGPFAVIGGLLGLGLSDAAITAYNSLAGPDKQLPTTSEGIRSLYEMVGMGGVKPETRGERMLAAGSEALVGTVPSVAAGRAGSALPGGAGAVATEVSRAPLTQIITSAPIASGTQFVAEATNNPALALAAGAGAGAASGVRPRIRGQAPTMEAMEKSVNSAYNILNKSNVAIDDTSFKNSFAATLNKDLRAEGYSPTNPNTAGIASLIDDLASNTEPKNATELQAIRKRITSSASPNDPEAYRMMRIVRDKFDDYLANLPDSSVIAGKKSDLDAWKTARGLFQKQSKANVFAKILEDAPVSQGQFSQSGMENYLYNELKKIARSESKMRLFSKSEQDSIREAAKGSNMQNVLKVFGKLSPTGYFPMMGTLGVGAFSPELASGMAATGMASRYAAEQMRVGDIQRIIDQILTGRPQPSPMANVPVTTMRGLLSTQYGME